MDFKSLKKDKGKVAGFGLILIAIIFLMSGYEFDLPEVLDRILFHPIAKIIILIGIVLLAQKSLEAAIIVGIIFIYLSERIINKELENM